MSADPLDVQLEDTELKSEVELTAALIVAANSSDAPMSDAEIDRVLGVVPEQRSAHESDPASL